MPATPAKPVPPSSALALAKKIRDGVAARRKARGPVGAAPTAAAAATPNPEPRSQS